MDTQIISETFPFRNFPFSKHSEQMTQSTENDPDNKDSVSVLGDLSSQHELEKLIQVSVEKIAAEKRRPSGANLHKSLLICDVIFKARVSLISMSQDQNRDQSRSVSPNPNPNPIPQSESLLHQNDSLSLSQGKANSGSALKQVSNDSNENQKPHIQDVYHERFVPTPLPTISQSNENIPPAVSMDELTAAHQKSRKRKHSETLNDSEIFRQDQSDDDDGYGKRIRKEKADSNNNTGSETSPVLERNDPSPPPELGTNSNQLNNFPISAMNTCIFPFPFVYPFPLVPNVPVNSKLSSSEPDSVHVDQSETESKSACKPGTPNGRSDCRCLWCSQGQVLTPFGQLSAFHYWLFLNNAAAFWSSCASAYNFPQTVSEADTDSENRSQATISQTNDHCQMENQSDSVNEQSNESECRTQNFNLTDQIEMDLHVQEFADQNNQLSNETFVVNSNIPEVVA